MKCVSFLLHLIWILTISLIPRKQKGKVNLRNYQFHVYKIELKTKPSREILERELPGTGIEGRRAGIRLKILARWAAEKKRTGELKIKNKL